MKRKLFLELKQSFKTLNIFFFFIIYCLIEFLKNPYYIESLKNLTGMDEEVQKYVLESNETEKFIKKLFSFIDYMIPLYCNEGKSQLVIAIGCTGGKHRSVTISNLLYSHLLEKDLKVCINHRDIKR